MNRQSTKSCLRCCCRSISIDQACKPQEQVHVTVDELNEMRYACGYVPHSLLKRFQVRSGEKYSQFVECLGNMAVTGEGGDLMSYTKMWFERVNRGGLFPLNDSTHCFFVEVEKAVRVFLPQHVTKSSDQDFFKAKVINTIVKDEEVQWQWTLMSQDIDNEEHGTELLTEIVQLWVTIRGFSLAASWIESYKRNNHTTTKKSRGLRKSLSGHGISKKNVSSAQDD